MSQGLESGGSLISVPLALRLLLLLCLCALPVDGAADVAFVWGILVTESSSSKLGMETASLQAAHLSWAWRASCLSALP